MSPDAPLIILASRSPRRRQLLSDAGYRFVVHPPDERVESGVGDGLRPDELVRELAYLKAASIARQITSGRLDPFAPQPPSDVRPALQYEQTKKESSRRAHRPKLMVLGCDTVAECAGQILGKPLDRSDARRMLQTLRGRPHRVLSGLCLWPIDKGEPSVEVATTLLRMDPLSNEQLDDYLSSDHWKGKAGAFGYQDRTGWVHVIEGSKSNVVGLPMELLATMLTRLNNPAPPPSV